VPAKAQEISQVIDAVRFIGTVRAGTRPFALRLCLTTVKTTMIRLRNSGKPASFVTLAAKRASLLRSRVTGRR
jgi:hypothetical protein